MRPDHGRMRPHTESAAVLSGPGAMAPGGADYICVPGERMAGWGAALPIRITRWHAPDVGADGNAGHAPASDRDAGCAGAIANSQTDPAPAVHPEADTNTPALLLGGPDTDTGPVLRSPVTDATGGTDAYCHRESALLLDRDGNGRSGVGEHPEQLHVGRGSCSRCTHPDCDCYGDCERCRPLEVVTP